MARVTWYKDDHELKDDHHIAIISAGEMHAVNIFNVTVKDEAVYRCVVANAAGSIHTDCEVLVEGNPIWFVVNFEVQCKALELVFTQDVSFAIKFQFCMFDSLRLDPCLENSDFPK